MRSLIHTGLATLLAVSVAAGCSDSQRVLVPKLQTALTQAGISLGDSVGVAMAETSSPRALKAELNVSSDPVFSVGTLAGGTRRDVKVDIVRGSVLSVSPGATAGDPCPGSIALNDAIARAETEGQGRAVSIQPDDDDACDREVQVLRGDTLWEVKIGRDGSVKEKEVSDGNND